MKDWTQEYNQAMIDSREDKRVGDLKKERAEEIKKRLHVEAEKVRNKQQESKE